MTTPASLSEELRQLSVALNRVNQCLQSDSAPDPVVLLEFRQSLDNARLTAWSVSELLNAQRIKRDPDQVFAFLSAERLRRLDQLVRNLCGDIDRKVITRKNYAWIRSLTLSRLCSKGWKTAGPPNRRAKKRLATCANRCAPPSRMKEGRMNTRFPQRGPLPGRPWSGWRVAV